MRKQQAWLTYKRITVYPKIMVVILVLIGVTWILKSKNMVDLEGKPLGYDFITYWSASKMALSGHAADAYSIPAIFRVERSVVPASTAAFAWYYPPTFFLVISPLALLPYLVSYFVFVSTTLAAYVVCVRRVVWSKEAMWCLAGFSGLWLNLFQGQNAFLTAALAAASILSLEESPILAGTLIGLLSIKPHLALLFPLCLIAIRAWKALISATITSGVLLGCGVIILGSATLKGCIGSIS